MRIGLVARRFDPAGGGTERDLIITARILVGAGHQVSIYAATVRGAVTEWPVHRVHAPRLGRALELLWFARAAALRARSDDADLVLSFARIVDADVMRSGGGAHASYLAAARRWRSPARTVAMRLSPYHRVQQMIERRGFGSARMRLAIAVSDFVRRDLVTTFGLRAERVVTLYNGVDLARFAPIYDRRTSRARISPAIPRDAPTALFIGNGFARKGLGLLLEAWRRMNPAALLMVAGADRAIPSYQRTARRLGLADRVRFLGPRSDINQLLNAADAFALPSLFEPFGNVALEALAVGVPALTTVLCGVAEVMPPALQAFVVQDPTDPAEIAAKLEAILSSGGSFAQLARATAEQFTWERHARELLELVETAAARG